MRMTIAYVHVVEISVNGQMWTANFNSLGLFFPHEGCYMVIHLENTPIFSNTISSYPPNNFQKLLER